MKILILTTHCYPDVAATGIIMRYLSEDLAKSGNTVTVITSIPHYDKGNALLSKYKSPGTEELCDGRLKICRVPVYAPKRKSWIFGRALSFFSFAILSVVRSVSVGRHDVILVLSPPLSNALTADLLSRFSRTPFVLNVQDIWPDAVIRAGAVRNSIIVFAARWLERYVYGRSWHVVVVSQNMRNALLPKTQSPVTVIENFCDVDFLRPFSRHNDFSQLHDLDRSFVVLFAGNIGYSQGLETLIGAALLLTDMKDVLFLIVGNGVMKGAIATEVKRLNLSNVRFLPFQPHEVVPLMFASADVGVVLLRKGFSSSSEPSKLLSIMAVGRPTIAAIDPQSDSWRLIEQTQCGICVEPENSTAIAASIRKLAACADLRSVLGSNARRAVVDRFSRADGVRKYEHLFASIVRPARARTHATT